MEFDNGNNIPVIEITANHIYLIILGDKKSIDNLVSDLNERAVSAKNTNSDSSKSYNISNRYYCTKIDTPLAQEYVETIIPEIRGKVRDLKQSLTISISEGAEIAQCYTLAQGKEYHRNLHMLTLLEDNCLFGFPKFDLNEECDPEKIIMNWFKKMHQQYQMDLKKI